MATHANLETDYSSSEDDTDHLAEPSCSEDEETNSTRKELLDGILSSTKTNANSVYTNDNTKAPKTLSVEAKVNVKCDELVPGVSRLAKEDNLCNSADAVLQPP
jgi:hypothetical protein